MGDAEDVAAREAARLDAALNKKRGAAATAFKTPTIKSSSSSSASSSASAAKPSQGHELKGSEARLAAIAARNSEDADRERAERRRAEEESRTSAAADMPPEVADKFNLDDAERAAQLEREQERFGKMLQTRTDPKATEYNAAKKAAAGGSDGAVLARFVAPGTERASCDSEFCAAVVAEVNKVRCDPHGYAASLRARCVPRFGTPPTRFIRFSDVHTRGTAEGVAALESLCARLDALSGSLGKVTRNDTLGRSLLDLVADDGPRGHVGPPADAKQATGSTAAAMRLLKYGRWRKKINELLCYGPYDAADVVYQWLVDDGNAARQYRDALLDPTMAVVAVACGPHAKLGSMCVGAFTCGYDAGAAPPQSTTTTTVEREADRTTETHRERTSALQESADGRSFVIALDDAGVDRAALKLCVRGKTIALERSIDNGATLKRFRWEVPVGFEHTAVSARLDTAAPGGRLHITVAKPAVASGGGGGDDAATSAPDPSTVHVLGEQSLSASPGAPAKLVVEHAEDDTRHTFTVRPTANDERVTVKLHGDTLKFQYMHTVKLRDEQGEYESDVGAVKSLQLPLAYPLAHYRILSSSPTTIVVAVFKHLHANASTEEHSIEVK